MRINELYEKEVISIKDGARLGEISDFEMNTETGELISLILYGRLRFFGLLGRRENHIIPWNCVKVIGDDTILVDVEVVIENKPKNNKVSLLKNLVD